MNQNIAEIEFTIFDTETTGLNPDAGDRIVELSACRIKANQKLAVFDTLINPRRAISPEAFAVNKISLQMLEHAPDAAAVLPKFLKFIDGSCLCSYNAGFDLGFLNAELKIADLPPLEGMVVLDILTLAKKLIPGLPRYALWFIAQRLGVSAPQVHRALADVELTWEVFLRLQTIAGQQGIVSLEGFSKLCAFNPALLDTGRLDKVRQIQACIRDKKIIKITYLSSATGGISQREVIPQEIKQDNQTRYLVGICCLKKEQRTFRLDNILDLEVA